MAILQGMMRTKNTPQPRKEPSKCKCWTSSDYDFIETRLPNGTIKRVAQLKHTQPSSERWTLKDALAGRL